MKYLLIILFSTQLSATEIYLGAGTTYRADEAGQNFIYTASIERNKWKLEYSYFEDYNRSSRYRLKHPLWPQHLIRQHKTLSVSKQIYSKKLNDSCNFYFDFGIAYSSNISRATSSNFLFHEALGFQCDRLRLEINHRSNAGLKGVNTGEDGLYLNYLIWEG